VEGRYFSEELNLQITLHAGPDGSLLMERPRGDKLRFTRSAAGVYTSPDQIILKYTRDREAPVMEFTLTFGRVTDLRFVRQRF
jgi:hypothetical protein